MIQAGPRLHPAIAPRYKPFVTFDPRCTSVWNVLHTIRAGVADLWERAWFARLRRGRTACCSSGVAVGVWVSSGGYFYLGDFRFGVATNILAFTLWELVWRQPAP